MSRAGLKRAVVMVVLRSADALLLIRRGKQPNLGKYVPVGGHVDPFESPRDAAIREVEEETGCHLADVQFRGVLVETSPIDYNWVVFVYSAEVKRIEPPACPEGVLEWVDFSRVASLPTPAADMHLYQLILRGQPFVLNAVYDGELNLLCLEDELSGQVFHSVDARPLEGRAPLAPAGQDHG